MNMSKSENSAYIRHIFANSFYIGAWCIFSKLFQRIRNQREILGVLIPILNFLMNKFFSLFLALFVNFNCKCAQNGSKKRQTFFYDCVLEFY